MFCQNCGNELHEQAIICPKCGMPTLNYYQQSKCTSEINGFAIAGFICSFFIPLLGWIFGSIGLSRAIKRNEKKGLAITSLIISSITFIINLIILL